uniref:DNA repair metallo-beta-lactamase domain-containing protein n=1 Tax=Romanomermis culicivorax TaxID=13658 RepID=A0A915JH35_ROMCU
MIIELTKSSEKDHSIRRIQMHKKRKIASTANNKSQLKLEAAWSKDEEKEKSDSDIEFLESTASTIEGQEQTTERFVFNDLKFASTKLTTDVQQTSILNFVQKTIIKKGGENRTAKIILDKNKSVANIVGDEAGCPAYKRVQGTPYAVDAFSYGSLKGVSIYFLSHFHYDHYCGLTKRFDKLIYCSTITASLLRTCPGAVLFLFRLKNGRRILHTGDLRADKENVVDSELWKTIDIDLIYLDTTYCNPMYKFPTQNEIVRQMTIYVQQILTENSKTLICVGSYSIGKEKVFRGAKALKKENKHEKSNKERQDRESNKEEITISDKLNLKIYCNSQKSRLLRCLDDQQLESRLTTKSKETKLHVVPMNMMRLDARECRGPQKLEDYFDKFADQYDRLLAIKPTGWEFRTKKRNLGELNISRSGNITMLGVPYSEHSSFEELKSFIQTLKPKKVIPTVFNNDKDLKRILNQIESWMLETN